MPAEHKPNEKDRAMVEKMASFGIPQEDIAQVLGIESKTLRKHYRHELDTAKTLKTLKVAQSLFDQATGAGPGAVTAAIFWLKTQAGWREKQEVELQGDLNVVALPELDKREWQPPS